LLFACWTAERLADSDVQTQTISNVSTNSFYQSINHPCWVDLRRWVVVLEEVQIGATGILHLICNCLTGRAGEGRDHIRVTRRDSNVTQVLGNRGKVVGVGRAAHRAGKLSKVDLAITTEAVRRGLKIFQLGEQEDQTASLAGVRGGDIKVESARDARGNGAIVTSTSGLIRGRRVNSNDQVGELIIAGEIGRAAAASSSG